jgi:nitric oxide dioxygenase
VDLDLVQIPSHAQVYLCGSLPFVDSVRRTLIEQHIPEPEIRYEFFGPDSGSPRREAKPLPWTQ